MTYEKQTWKGGDTITAEKLNHIEDGIANSGGGAEPLIVNAITEGGVTTLDKTWKQIRDSLNQGKVCVIHDTNGIETVSKVMINTDHDETVYSVNFIYSAQSENGYPSVAWGDDSVSEW